MTCKVEFYQPSCWLYSVPNLLVFQQLVTLYLGEILVRVVSEILWRNAQACKKNRDSQLDLVGDLRLQATRNCSRVRHARSWSITPAGALHDKIRQLAIQLPRGWNLRLNQAARLRRKPALFWKTWLFTFHSHPSINTLFCPLKKESFQREFWERNPKEKQEWFIPNLH